MTAVSVAWAWHLSFWLVIAAVWLVVIVLAGLLRSWLLDRYPPPVIREIDEDYVVRMRRGMEGAQRG